ncbi:DUF1330 domain-containing protein [Microbacterium sp. KKR3/1]|uniref:DUF1330 domain-containing protein n=1 Tax=unclassified Microbacterium TaxID=2609290 RepID=UPI001E3FBEFA|nr:MULTISPECIES: DUF1330 domain-containing protein [unclassified Microbacterium]MCE0509573.1 DUF1330 domain-containing protein [Microbacterium sp. KKR3/1]UUE20688.1 DUF1330 domain-containing protein [Microbacterium sp. J1-1]
MTVYWVNTFTAIRDPQRVREYASLAGPAMEAAGGVFLAKGDPVAVLEGADLRSTIIAFPDRDAAIAAYASPAYQRALEVLGDAAERQIRVLAAVGDSAR